MIFRWIMIAILLLVVASWLFSKRLPWLEKMGLTPFKSELRFSLFGRALRLPVTLVIVLCTVAYLAMRLIFA